MRIAISGPSGCGNTTVSTLLSQRLGCKMINYTFRSMAQERGIDFWQMCAMAEKDDNVDIQCDNRQVEMAMEEKDCVLGSRLAIWMLKEADLKVYLKASAQERARRIVKREGGSYELRYGQTVARDAHDTARYKRIYNIDNTTGEQVADLVIDTEGKTPAQIVDLILSSLK